MLLAADSRSSALDMLPSPYTDVVGSIADRAVVRRGVEGVDAILHAATLHKPHVDSHTRQEFVDTNVTGTLNLLEEAVAAGVARFVFTSTTSAFGRALTPPPGAPAAWVTEDVAPVPRNIYGVTKAAAEDLCELFHRDHGLPILILRTSRFFPEGDDRDDVRSAYEDANLKVNELLYRRVDLADVVERPPARARPRAGARLRPLHRQRHDAVHSRGPGAAARRRARRGAPALPEPSRRSTARAAGRMFDGIERVYVNARARRDLGWRPTLRLRLRARARSPPGRSGEASWRSRSARRATTRSRPAPTPPKGVGHSTERA